MKICETKVTRFLKGNLGDPLGKKRRHVRVNRELQMRMGPVWVEIRMMTDFEMKKQIRWR